MHLSEAGQAIPEDLGGCSALLAEPPAPCRPVLHTHHQATLQTALPPDQGCQWPCSAAWAKLCPEVEDARSPALCLVQPRWSALFQML